MDDRRGRKVAKSRSGTVYLFYAAFKNITDVLIFVNKITIVLIVHYLSSYLLFI